MTRPLHSNYSTPMPSLLPRPLLPRIVEVPSNLAERRKRKKDELSDYAEVKRLLDEVAPGWAVPFSAPWTDLEVLWMVLEECIVIPHTRFVVGYTDDDVVSIWVDGEEAPGDGEALAAFLEQHGCSYYLPPSGEASLGER
jgi:hypothetical protein